MKTIPEPLFNCLGTAETILHTMCAESIATRKQQNLQPPAGENKLAILPDRNAMLIRLSWAKDLPTTISKQSNLEPLVQEINVTKNPMIESTQPPESSHNPLHSPEAIAERLRLRAGSASGTTDDDQPEVAQ